MAVEVIESYEGTFLRFVEGTRACDVRVVAPTAERIRSDTEAAAAAFVALATGEGDHLTVR